MTIVSANTWKSETQASNLALDFECFWPAAAANNEQLSYGIGRAHDHRHEIRWLHHLGGCPVYGQNSARKNRAVTHLR
jgi:hypothetical protein